MQALIVDDDELSLELLRGVLTDMGYDVATATDGRQALEYMRQSGAQLVITDWEMPELNGLDLCRRIRADDYNGYVYIIMLTGNDSPERKIEGLYAGADNFLTKPLNPAELMVSLKIAERILSLETRDLALFALAKLAESRDSETGSHVERVQSYARLLAQDLSCTEKYRDRIDAEFVRLVYQTSPLHDIGKVGIPDQILLKPGKLTPQEFDVMKKHADMGAQTLEAALKRFPNAKFLQLAREIAISHHEKYDGTGYPKGLKGDAIPLSGRIVALADVYDALTSRRVYKSAMSHAQARAIIIKESGKHFDPDIVAAFIRCEKQFVSIASELRDPDEAGEAERSASRPSSTRVDKSSQNLVLVVDDEPDQAAILEEMISAAGYQVLTADNGVSALEIIAREHPRLVISDWFMPGMDGMALCRAVRGMRSLPHTYFVLLTIHADKQHLVEAFDAGVDDFVPKPVSEVELLARVRAGLRGIALHDELVNRNLGSQELNAQLAVMNDRLERLAITDELTGAFNRRHAMTRLEESWAVADRYRHPLSLLIVDIDHFKHINDSFGHPSGDVVLRELTRILNQTVRATDTVCRIGGEEFLVICPAENSEEAQICAERCRQAVEGHAFNVEGATIDVRVSVGVATRSLEMMHFMELLTAADNALYDAKHAGRNQVSVSLHKEPAPQA